MWLFYGERRRISNFSSFFWPSPAFTWQESCNVRQVAARLQAAVCGGLRQRSAVSVRRISPLAGPAAVLPAAQERRRLRRLHVQEPDGPQSRVPVDDRRRRLPQRHRLLALHQVPRHRRPWRRSPGLSARHERSSRYDCSSLYPVRSSRTNETVTRAGEVTYSNDVVEGWPINQSIYHCPLQVQPRVILEVYFASAGHPIPSLFAAPVRMIWSMCFPWRAGKLSPGEEDIGTLS